MSVTRDFYQRFVKPDASDSQMILVTRIAIAVVAVLSFLVAYQYRFILRVLLYAISIYVAAFVPSILAAFYWKRATKIGALLSMLVGGVSVLIIMLSMPKLQVPALIGLPISAVVLIVFSLVTKPDEEKARAFLEKTKA
jgi:Na+/proline symporter